ncbi:hypothetical protein ACXR0O_19345 [Verrucomicrobiota bacterium sgz303538]
MTFLFEKPEPLIVAGVNWPTLDYLIERFNRSGLEGFIVLRRTPLQKNLQLYLTAESNGKTFSLLSEAFEDTLLTESAQREQLIRVVSRFLLRAKHQHAELVSPPSLTSANSLLDLLGEGASPSIGRRDAPDDGKIEGNPEGESDAVTGEGI